MIKEKIIKLSQQLENYISRQTLTRLAISVALIVFLVYVNSLFNGFVWDDEEQILNNQLIHHLGNWWRLFMGSTFNSGGGGLSGWYYKPLMPLTFMLSWFIWGGWAGGYHLFQLVLHLANVVLVMLLVFKLFQNKDRQKAKVIAFISALIWGVHSGISEAVFYLSAVQEVLFTFFILASLLVLLSEKMDDKKWLAYGVLIFLALLGKESALSGIAIGGLYLLFFGQSGWLNG